MKLFIFRYAKKNISKIKTDNNIRSKIKSCHFVRIISLE